MEKQLRHLLHNLQSDLNLTLMFLVRSFSIFAIFYVCLLVWPAAMATVNRLILKQEIFNTQHAG